MLDMKKLIAKILGRLISLNERDNIKIATAYLTVGQIAANSYKDVTFNYSSANFDSSKAVFVNATLNSSGTSNTLGNICVAVANFNATSATIRIFNSRSSTVTPMVICTALQKV